MGLDFEALCCGRANAVDASGIRRIFDLAATLDNPINLSIGQPDFPVPREIKDAVINAIEHDHNGYTPTQGAANVLEAVNQHIAQDIGWTIDSHRLSSIVTSGTSGALFLAAMALLEPGDELIFQDPWFVLYPRLAALTGARAVTCDTYPDFRMTAARIEPLITDRTKAVLIDSPGNPTGVVLNHGELQDIVALCKSRGVVLISDEIYDEFTFPEALHDGFCPSPARLWDETLLIRGLGKTFGCTGWRLGIAAGPSPLIEAMAKIQQFTFVCAPSMAQHAFLARPHVSMASEVDSYAERRDRVVTQLSQHTEVVRPGGAFYVFAKVPEHLGLTGTAFVKRAIERGVLIIPGDAFSTRDTHFRLSYAVDSETLDAGLAILVDLMRSG